MRARHSQPLTNIEQRNNIVLIRNGANMQTKIVPFSTFQNDLRDVVLRSLDEFAAEVMETEKVKGWKDRELPALFTGVDAHAKALALRLNDGNEVNSAYVRIDMDA